MDPALDLAKLVGAASAPVALIIAAAIFLSNLTGKYGAMFAATRRLFAEYRDRDDGDNRRRLLAAQLTQYGRRLRIMMRASFWLCWSILAFIATVALTSVSVVAPKVLVWKVGTALAMAAGLLLLAMAVTMELREGRLAAFALRADLDEFPELHESSADRDRAKNERSGR